MVLVCNRSHGAGPLIKRPILLGGTCVANINFVVFAYPVLHPSGGMSSSIRADGGVTIDRRGDTVVVKAPVPDNTMRGLPTHVCRHYNWNAVTWIEYDSDPDAVVSADKRGR